ncbi:unnamed protein product [Polarella glacialis]|uniref:nicotinamidase n=1 Tax=Polarella glacialis TaxID=89957 RepID=A0A813HC86_POLGL|nr:unnamed protein product [Polarella glacialis]
MASFKLAALLHGLASMGAHAGKSALVLVDVQDCFLDNPALTANKKAGSLGVNASHIIPVINNIRTMDCLFDIVVMSQDYHPANHISFGSTHGLAAFSHLGGKGGLPITCIKPTSGSTADAACCPTVFLDKSKVDCSAKLCAPDTWDYTVNNSAFVASNPACTKCKTEPASCFEDVQAMWTDHCEQTGDSGFAPMTKKATDIVVQKGKNIYVDAYSAFMDNSGNLKTELDATLQKNGIDTLYIAGIATDVCVKWTVRDALKSSTGNYTVHLITDATAGLTTEG